MSRSLIAPHGGTLVNRIVDEATASTLKSEANDLPSITLSDKQACDLEMIAIGAFSPLTGFVGQADFERIYGNIMKCKQDRRIAFLKQIPLFSSLSKHYLAKMTGMFQRLNYIRHQIVFSQASVERNSLNQVRQALRSTKST